MHAIQRINHKTRYPCKIVYLLWLNIWHHRLTSEHQRVVTNDKLFCMSVIAIDSFELQMYLVLNLPVKISSCISWRLRDEDILVSWWPRSTGWAAWIRPSQNRKTRRVQKPSGTVNKMDTLINTSITSMLIKLDKLQYLKKSFVAVSSWNWWITVWITYNPQFTLVNWWITVGLLTSNLESSSSPKFKLLQFVP